MSRVHVLLPSTLLQKLIFLLALLRTMLMILLRGRREGSGDTSENQQCGQGQQEECYSIVADQLLLLDVCVAGVVCEFAHIDSDPL